MKTTTRSRTTTEACAEPGQEGEALSQVVILLRALQESVDEILAQLAGASKSHYTVDEFARVVGRAPYTIRSWVTQKRIRAERVSGTGPRGRLLIPREELKKLVASARGENVPAVLVD